MPIPPATTMDGPPPKMCACAVYAAAKQDSPTARTAFLESLRSGSDGILHAETHIPDLYAVYKSRRRALECLESNESLSSALVSIRPVVPSQKSKTFIIFQRQSANDQTTSVERRDLLSARLRWICNLTDPLPFQLLLAFRSKTTGQGYRHECYHMEADIAEALEAYFLEGLVYEVAVMREGECDWAKPTEQSDRPSIDIQTVIDHATECKMPIPELLKTLRRVAVHALAASKNIPEASSSPRPLALAEPEIGFVNAGRRSPITYPTLNRASSTTRPASATALKRQSRDPATASQNAPYFPASPLPQPADGGATQAFDEHARSPSTGEKGFISGVKEAFKRQRSPRPADRDALHGLGVGIPVENDRTSVVEGRMSLMDKMRMWDRNLKGIGKKRDHGALVSPTGAGSSGTPQFGSEAKSKRPRQGN